MRSRPGSEESGTPPPGAGGRPDILQFAASPSIAATAMARAILQEPLRALSVLWARLIGKRLRARQSFVALVGADHRLTLDRHPPTEPTSALAEAGIDAVEVGCLCAGTASIVLVTRTDQQLVAGSAKRIAAAFEDASLHALYGDALLALDGSGRALPILRPAFDPDYLRGIDYVGPVVAFRRSSLEAELSELPREAEPRDWLLRIDALFGGGAIRHLPRVLSVWRTKASSLRAERSNPGDAEHLGSGLLRSARNDEPHPLVSLIVPTRDRLDLLKPCIASLEQRTDWPAKEILVCDNDSREPETLAYLEALAAAGRARVIRCPGPFDFAAMNNAAAAQAQGRLLAFVNNDVEAFQADWLVRMVREALRPEIGAVGAKLLDGEGRIQHGGIVLGTGGLVTHGHRHFAGDAPGYLGALTVTHRVSAVTAACLVIEAEKFRRVGGFDAEAFAVDFNDVDLCLRLNASGLHTLLVPSAVLHHREAASRRRTPEASARHDAEVAALRRKWGPLLEHDPHYHPGFDPNLSTHARLRPGWTGLEPAAPR